MTYKTQAEFIQKNSTHKLAIVEYCHQHEGLGLSSTQIQAKLLIDNIVRSPRSLYDNWKFYDNNKNSIGWK